MVIKKSVGLANQRSPYVGTNGNWFTWNEFTLQFEDTGEKAKGKNGKSPDISFRLEPNGDLYAIIN